ncbi:hypothetical protein M9H77_22383 [Catharanthus roseus]|uniref:Uncharacterized protein n=1 Tax=Catharanthus roseus TaxID=4058 RepID=A0ACC0ART3_CATRO|nr:hypothetical protein M9H77_22383 [Catharanthus roseus]
MSSSVMFDPSCYGFGNLDDTSLVKLNIVGIALGFDRKSLQHEAYYGVRRPRQKYWRKTNILLWRFNNEFFFKLVPLLPCVFLQRVKIEICYLWNSYGVETFVNKLDALFVYSLQSLDCLGTVALLQGLVIRAMARIIEEEHQGKIAIFDEMIQDLAWQMIGAQEEDFRRSKTFLLSSVQVEESKEASLGSLDA